MSSPNAQQTTIGYRVSADRASFVHPGGDHKVSPMWDVHTGAPAARRRRG